MSLLAGLTVVALLGAESCTDLLPDYQDRYGRNCTDYVNENLCTEYGDFGSGWLFNFGFYAEAWPSLPATSVCCGCGAGQCRDKTWLDSRGYSCDYYISEGRCANGTVIGDVAAHAVENISAADACCVCGGGCESSPSWRDARGNNCRAYYESQWCLWTGGVGPGWNSTWGSIEDYAVDGVSAWDACCECSRCQDELHIDDQAELESYAALNCSRAVWLRTKYTYDLRPLSHLRSVAFLDMSEFRAPSLEGLEGTTVERIFRLYGDNNPSSLRGLGKFAPHMRAVSVDTTKVQDLADLPPFTSVSDGVYVQTNTELVSIAGLGHLRQAGHIQIRDNEKLRSLHGLEHVHTLNRASALHGRSVSCERTPLESLDGLGGLRGPVGGAIHFSLLHRPAANLTVEGLFGITELCTTGCDLRSLRIEVSNAADDEDSFCITESHRAALADIAGTDTPVEIMNATFVGCQSCDRDCGQLPHGYRVSCDYAVGVCACPLGTAGTNCSMPAPQVHMLPGQSKECTRPRMVEGNVSVCEFCVRVQTNDYDTLALDPPRTFRVMPANSTMPYPWPQQMTWHTASEGELCINMTVPPSDPPAGVEILELAASYSERTQDWFLPGSIQEPLRNPVEPMYPWCLESGDCSQFGNDTTRFVLMISEPPTGRPTFQFQEMTVTEGQVDVGVVLFRSGGDYGTLTAIVGVDPNRTTAIAGLQYNWANEIISWPHGDATPKAFVMSFPDDAVYQPDRNLTLQILTQDVQSDSRFTLVITDDGDAGMLGFSEQRRSLVEGLTENGCLLFARREGGSSGRAQAQVALTRCDGGEALATENEDFILETGVLTWEDEVTGEQCALWSSTGLLEAGDAVRQSRLVLFQDAETEADESVCFGLSALPESAAEVTSAERSTFTARATLVLQDQGATGGPPQAHCVRGTSCSVDLSQSGLVRFAADAAWSSGGTNVVMLELRSCRSCEAATAATSSVLSRNYTAELAAVSMDPDQYLACLCTCSGGSCLGRAVASVTVAGAKGGQQAHCSLGQPCQLPRLQGVELQAGDAVTAAESCGETELLPGLPGSRVAIDEQGDGTYIFPGPGLLMSSSGVFALCWCRPGASTCTAQEDFTVQVGLFKASGPRLGRRAECRMSSSCDVLGLTGTGLTGGDKLMALDSCGSAAGVDWGAELSVATTADGANYSFGLLATAAGRVQRELNLCWCAAGARCESPADFRAPAGKLLLLCPQGQYWPTVDGVAEPFGECQACQNYQKTIQEGAVGRAACVCQTQGDGWPFQEVTEGNCGCRDGYHWSMASNSCVPCNRGQSCAWQNIFSQSLDLPPLVPGFWSNPEGSVYRCFSDRTCPHTNSQCANGRAGKACGLCAPGYVGGHDGPCRRFSESCANSSSEENLAAFIPLIILATLAAASLLLVLVASNGRKGSSHKMSVYVTTASLSAWRTSVTQNFQYLQLLSIVSLFEVRWPNILAEIWALVRAITMDIMTFPSLGCLMPTPSAFVEMLVRYLVPVALAALTVCSWGLLKILQKCLKPLPGSCVAALRAKVAVSGSHVLELLMLAGCLFFSVLVRNGFILFTCARGPNNVSTVVIYPHIDCPSITNLGDLRDWFELLPFALAYNVVFSIGLTFGVWYAARRTVQHMVQNNFADRGPWGFLSWEFRATYAWWLLVKMSRDLLINVLAAAFTNLGSVQLLSTAVVSLVYAYWCQHSHPFQDPLNNMLETWCSVSVGAICFFAAGMGYAFDSDNDYSRAYLDEGGPETDTSYRDQILLTFQLVSFAGAVFIMLMHLMLVLFPGKGKRCPKRFRQCNDEELKESVSQLRDAFEAADLQKLDDIEVLRNLKILNESPATLDAESDSIAQLPRARSTISVMPGRRYMAHVSKQVSIRSVSNTSLRSSKSMDVAKANSEEMSANLSMSPTAGSVRSGSDDQCYADKQGSGEMSPSSPNTHGAGEMSPGSPTMSSTSPTAHQNSGDGQELSPIESHDASPGAAIQLPTPQERVDHLGDVYMCYSF